ncbi:MAG: hypothetical protein methR_P1032 [Methyloprofundus sp.]|nr:MAG: hypothetical protein methR_P1032 [Methyloprofundus sp.]
MKKIRVNKRDQHRVLLTEVLPYETPFFFSNEGFYKYCGKKFNDSPLIIKKLIGKWKSDSNRPNPKDLNTIPYSYEIRKNVIENRTLSLMHPAIQLQVVALYSEFSHIILNLCQRSQFSLRHPNEIVSMFYGQDGPRIDEELQYCSNYFEYEKYNFLYNFFDSYEFNRLEKRFPHLRTFDISKCFDHIYTHTISWAVKSKSFAKEEIRKRTFDSDFDALMQASNYKETAGILIGSEVSRIFAEIILQKVDANVINKAEEEGLKIGVDYNVRRYVDDYFVFSLSAEIGQQIMRLFSNELKLYRLSFNEAKTNDHIVPFMTPISSAKIELSGVFNDFFDSMVERNSADEIFISWRVERKSLRFIQKIKSIIKIHNINYVSVSSLIFSILEKRLKENIKQLLNTSDSKESIGYLLFALVEVTFFVYAMDVRVSSTYKVTRICIEALKAIESMPADIIDKVKKKIHDESMLIFDIEINKQPDLYMEIINLLAVCKLLGDEYRLPTKKIDYLIKRNYSETLILGNAGTALPVR